MSGLFDQITNYSPPLLTAGQVNYKGTWNAATNSPTLVSPPASTSKGDYYVVSAAGTQFGISFAVGDWIISNGTAWEKVDLTDAVSSVFGRTGAITAASGDYTASQVTNVPAGTISSTNVQDAINELSSDIATAQNVLDAYVTNAESVAITKGQVVYAFGATGNRMSVKLANNSADATSAKTVGVVLDSSIAAGNPGYIRMVGVVDGLNLGTFTDGDTLYLGATAGTVTATKPYAPNHLVYVGIVERANNGNGQLYVRVQNGYELDEIHDVQITSAPASGALLVRDATNSLWKAARLTAGTNIAVTNADASVTVGVTGIIGSSNGGTGNGFTKFSGPTTSEKTFTLPNSNATLLYDGGALGTPSSGTVTNLTGTASININGTVGATTANTGAFTTLTTTGNLGAGTSSPSSRLHVSNGASSTTQISLGPVVSAGDYAFLAWNNNSGSQELKIYADAGFTSFYNGGSERGRFSSTGLAVTGALTTTGNVGIGVTPSAWASNYRAIQIGSRAVITQGSNDTYIGNNWINDGTNKYIATAAVSLYGQSSGAHIWYNAPSGTAGNAISFTQAMTLDSSGSLGLGDTSPSSNGKISSIIPSVGSYTGQTAAWYGSNGTGSMRLWIANLAYAGVGANEPWLHSYQNINIGSDANIAIKFLSGGERARIDSSGVLCVGATGFGYAVRAGFRGDSTSVSTVEIQNESSTGTMLTFRTNGESQVGSISFTASGVTYNTSSDYRRKSNVKDLTGSGSFIDALKPRTFDWDTGDKGVGFIAHEFAKVSPSSVHGEKDAVDADGKPIYQAMQASSAEVIANLVAEIQELRKRMAAVEGK